LRLAKQGPLDPYTGPPLPALSDMPNRFAPARDERSSDIEPRESRRAYVAVVAGSAFEMRQARPTVLGRYGANMADDWVPFAAERKPIALIAQQVVSALDLVHTPIRTAQGWLDQVRAAEDEHCPSLVLIDPWSAQLEAYRTRLEELDSALFRNCAVIVIWDVGEGEDTRRVQLETNLQRLLSRRRLALARTPLLCEDARDPAQLRAALAAALQEIETILAPFRPVIRPVESGTFAQRPGLSAA
jgi:FxsC-like protein